MTTTNTTKTVTFVSGNSNKLRELKQIMPDIEIDSRKIDLVEIQGDHLAVIKAKCELAVVQVNGPVLCEDSSLCFDALGDLPGVYVKHFLDAIGNTGLVNMLAGYDNKVAKAVCVFGYSKGWGYPVETFVGVVFGKIVDPRGSNGFGWDAIFLPDGYDQTYAEMDPELKNRMSDRMIAVNKVKRFLEEEKNRKQ